MNEEQERFYVIRTNCYGLRPHVNYTLTLASGNIALTETPTLEALLQVIPTDDYIAKDDITPVMDALAKTGGITQTDDERLAFAQEMVTRAITAHDTSSSVNGFILNGTTVWFDGTSLTIPCDTAIEMLSALEMYALQCFNTTAQHKANIAAMTTVDDVTAYDYTTGYPEKIELTL